MRSDNPFHAGEVAIHERLGIRERIADVGRRVIRPFMPEQHQRFYEQLPMLLVGSVDARGRPWASMLVGEPGFVRATSATALAIAARPLPGDPLNEGLRSGAPLGFLGIELHTRRRNRLSGRVAAIDAQGFEVAVEQTVGNCPQYIQGREFAFVRDVADQRPRRVEPLAALDELARRFIAHADTLFIATHAPAGPANGQAEGSADVSHRGGRAGFVKVEDERTLLIPDFTGNFLFMTFGNLELDARAGLLFVDFDSGDLLSLTGRAEVIWEGEELAAFEGAERVLRFTVDEGVRLVDALPLRWRFRDWSPNSLITGTWAEAEQRREALALAQSWRPYRVTRIVDESSVIRSFHLEPADGLGLPPFEAGQHLPIRLRTGNGGDGGKPLMRTYTISQAPGDPGLRLSVKREGVASRFLHDQVREGSVIEAMGPRGQFVIDAALHRPAVLIGAGVGITPMVSFLRHIVNEGFRLRRTRPVHLIQVARDAQVRAFGAELQQLAERANALHPGSVQVHLVLGRGGPGAHTGPLTVDLLKRLLPLDDHEFFLCGPGGFMQAIYDGLRSLGVRDPRIQAEAFGPSSLKRRGDAGEPAAPPPPPVARQATIVFTRSGEAAEWTPQQGTLLEFAEGKGLEPPFSCRSGSCGSCLTTMTSGRVSYAEPTAWRPGDGEVLLCCARPAEAGGERIELAL